MFWVFLILRVIFLGLVGSVRFWKYVLVFFLSLFGVLWVILVPFLVEFWFLNCFWDFFGLVEWVFSYYKVVEFKWLRLNFWIYFFSDV